MPRPSKISADAKRYYEGGYRMTIGGVPVRLARKPHSLDHRKMLRETNPFRPVVGKLPMKEDE